MTTDAETMDAAEAEAASDAAEATDPAGEALVVTFDDLGVLAIGDAVEVFVLNLELVETPPPYFIEVAGRRFAYSATTFLLKGHGAALEPFVRGHEAEGRLVLLVQRRSRYIAYVHDPAAGAEEAAE